MAISIRFVFSMHFIYNEFGAMREENESKKAGGFRILFVKHLYIWMHTRDLSSKSFCLQVTRSQQGLECVLQQNPQNGKYVVNKCVHSIICRTKHEKGQQLNNKNPPPHQC